MSERPKRIMGVDFGNTRTGLAVSDPTGLLATGIPSVRCRDPKKTAELVAEKAAEFGTELIVLGLPINMNGTEGPRCEETRSFGTLLGEISGLPVEYLDERLTTAAAHTIMNYTDTRGRRRKAAVDALSAEIILEHYLSRQKNQAK